MTENVVGVMALHLSVAQSCEEYIYWILPTDVPAMQVAKPNNRWKLASKFIPNHKTKGILAYKCN